ncbi:glycerophosphoryl diester phosphodiesterase [Ectopseudomonas composti]|uniref:Glycerophosphoryl diester phosphodiesterase n=1 Tax=Ectopseudomonas composti TaxID=658457 RepID=A0A1I5JIA1_9GAMM|nr:glycerophosphodiester phosphodiesterase [Pseudomonas composti]SFO72076.1 glycerophosphoryl diester phosphodiesterase [Pseudomonas composti]
MLRLTRFLIAPLLLIGVVVLVLALISQPASPPAVLADLGQRPLVIAHRGGMGLWPENTLFAFERAAALGVDMLEMDLHLSQDAKLVLIHDETLERTSNGQGPVAHYNLAELQALDAGYKWTADGGQSYPYRGQGTRIAALEEVFERFPLIPKALEIKVPDVGMEAVLCEMLATYDQLDRVIVASFHERSLQRFRQLCPEVATAGGPVSVRLLLALNWLGLSDLLSPSYPVLQIPQQHGGLNLATPRLVRNAQARGLQVHLWTINEQPNMRLLLEMGVNGLITDYPDRALQLLGRSTQLSALPSE